MGDQPDSQTICRFIRFSILGMYYCVRMARVRGIRNVHELNTEVQSPAKVGWISTESGPCQVVDVNNDLHADCCARSDASKIIVLKLSGVIFGILVDTVEEIFEVRTSQIYKIPKIVGGTVHCYFEEVVHFEKKLILSFSPEFIYVTCCLGKRAGFDYEYSNHNSVINVNLALVDHRKKKIVIFSATKDQNILYGLSITQIPQILQLSSILQVPRAGKNILGIIEWRGIILPIIDLSLCIENIKSDVEEEGRILVVRLRTIPIYIAIIVHPKVAINNFPINKGLFRESEPSDIKPVYRQFVYENKRLVIPDIDRLVLVDNLQ